MDHCLGIQVDDVLTTHRALVAARNNMHDHRFAVFGFDVTHAIADDVVATRLLLLAFR